MFPLSIGESSFTRRDSEKVYFQCIPYSGGARPLKRDGPESRNREVTREEEKKESRGSMISRLDDRVSDAT